MTTTQFLQKKGFKKDKEVSQFIVYNEYGESVYLTELLEEYLELKTNLS